MRCDKCGTENAGDATFCKECGSRLAIVEAPGEKTVTGESAPESASPEVEESPAIQTPTGVPAEAEPLTTPEGEMASTEEEVTPEPGHPTTLAHVLSTAWHRRGPILMALFTVLMMAMVFAPWAFLKLDLLGFQVVSNSYTGWGMFIPRILFFLSIIPLLISIMMIAGIGTRRGVVETHICTFVGGVIFTVWIIIFSLSQVLSALIKNVKVLEVNVAGAQVATIFFFIGFMVGVVLTSYDRGAALEKASMGG